jgi:hypothetical protein
MASRHCIVVSAAHLASRLTRAKQSKRPKRLMEAVSSFCPPETASLLQSAYSDYQIGAFENFHQLVEDALIVLRPRLQYELRFPNRMKRRLLISHLLISHRFLLTKQIAARSRRRKNQATFCEYPRFSWGYPINFCFNREPESAESSAMLARRWDQGERR